GMLVASVSGVITGVFGGILRDIFCNDIPLIFRRELYASVSFAAAWCYMLCIYLQLPDEQSILITLFGGFLLRLLAIRFHWEMPKFVYNDEA
ncbi:MAG: trimeric intracellular cation channel family protein, partial [Pseudomonas sp.]